MSTNENNKPSWSDAPEWAEWLARDRSGAWHWFETQPKTTTADTWEASFGNCRPVLDVIAWARLIEHRHDTRDEPVDDGVLSGAALHRAIADAMDRQADWWKEFEVENEFGGWWLAKDAKLVYEQLSKGFPLKYRKPKTRHLIDANGVRHEWPEPMRDMPSPNTRVWVTFSQTISYQRANGNHLRLLEQGRCHATREARDAHERALIAASTAGVTDV